MQKLITGKVQPYFETDSEQLFLGDAFELLSKLKKESVDMIFADPPYFLSGDSITCRGGKMVPVKKADWDSTAEFKEKHAFNRRWIKRCKRVLKPEGTIWISGTFHNIFSIGTALEQEGFKIINNITWQKTNPPPNLACKCFTHSTETVIWARKDSKKGRYLFNYELMKERNGGRQMKDVWTGSVTKPSEKKQGSHPTQKPEYLLENIILSSTKAGDVVLDPFCGSGTTGVVAKRYGRDFIGIDNCEEYLDIAARRMADMQQVMEF